MNPSLEKKLKDRYILLFLLMVRYTYQEFEVTQVEAEAIVIKILADHTTLLSKHETEAFYVENCLKEAINNFFQKKITVF